MLSLFPELLEFERLASFLLRLALGIIFIAHGYAKTFSKKDKATLAVGVFELAGGLMVFLGFLTQLGAIFLIVDRLGALWKTRFNGYEFNILALAAAISLLVLRSGFLSIDLPF
ncbi:hypothetical protein A3B18_01680 [Candidatus Giovannonibacteria bacterium RIFCSPLOWO2_01_FULL_46_13]|uniref:DoxX family protein n=1 Tax=Candidatus Giovannonibacteria bacterium RIFCSPLOWO2_01_FULL_46_13 TaxID=1798352 RepID=A0A1F5X5J8_9BACT|nr:MAG: hypothetical protein A3B18_01680 [Candidatus Giovannonibacteria bacterium RIFCSPLOWO2_01_FULL_46_13]